MHGSKNQSPTRTPKCWWRGKPENKTEKPLLCITTLNNQLMRIVAIHTAYKPSKLSSNYVLEPPTPTSNQFLESFLLTSLRICNWASNFNLQFSLAILRLFQWFPSSNQHQNSEGSNECDGLNLLSWNLIIWEGEGREIDEG